MLENGLPALGIKLSSDMIDENRRAGLISCFIFGWLTFWLIVAFMRTTFEDPQSIPDDYEWDMNSDTQSDMEASSG